MRVKTLEIVYKMIVTLKVSSIDYKLKTRLDNQLISGDLPVKTITNMEAVEKLESLLGINNQILNV